jgi:hypothetical protein
MTTSQPVMVRFQPQLTNKGLRVVLFCSAFKFWNKFEWVYFDDATLLNRHQPGLPGVQQLAWLGFQEQDRKRKTKMPWVWGGS